MKKIDYTFVCIGTNRIISDSFGPRVGKKLKQVFYKNENINVYGTMENPIHLKNVEYFLKKMENKNQIILIDSAIGRKEDIGNTYVNRGGMEIGKAFNHSIYIPANINIKTVIGAKEYMPNYSIYQIEQIANKVAYKIVQIVFELSV
ncbi:putative sporulation protein YyaC [Clostridium sp. CAG:567]|jgi:putative sporulation protein YyaC|nr:putative sporulation protein YyaC [Clostridium sp. CAG:567]